MDIFFSNSSSRKAREVYTNIKIEEYGREFKLGPYNAYHLMSDPKRIGFLFARYKFVAKMLEGQEKALEIGCQEGLGSLVVAKSVKKLVATDFYKPHIESCIERLSDVVDNIEFKGHDIISGPIEEKFDAAYSLDVFEHIDPAQADVYMKNVVLSLREHGAFIVGIPSLESQKYASSGSKEGHINCMSGEDLRAFCRQYFHSVFMFGMNDEVVHTGFLPMAHYLIALCVHPRNVVEK